MLLSRCHIYLRFKITPDQVVMDEDAEIPVLRISKKESTRDMLLIISAKVKVRFTIKDADGEVIGIQTLKGRWCLICR